MSQKGAKAVFLDRDGVINHVVERDGQWVSPRGYDEFKLVAEVEAAGKILAEAGYRLFVVTNQPDIPRGLMSYDDLERMHADVKMVLPQVEEIFACTHDNHHQCECRKPKPGAFLDLAQRYGLDLSRSWLIGDSAKDTGAGKAARLRTILLRRDYNLDTFGDAEVADILAAAALIVREDKMSYIDAFIDEARRIIDGIDKTVVDAMVKELIDIRARGGRLFILGSGGGAGHASHAVNDFRKICGIESYSPSDNVSELTARINDDGWDTCYVNWLRGSRMNGKDGILVFSVGGGNAEKNISMNIVNGLKLAQEVGASVLGVVGRDGGYTAKVGKAVVIIPPWGTDVTAQTEAFQAVVWHMLVSHPDLKQNEMKWESVHKSA